VGVRVFGANFLPQAFLYHVLECNPQHVTNALLKEYAPALIPKSSAPNFKIPALQLLIPNKVYSRDAFRCR